MVKRKKLEKKFRFSIHHKVSRQEGKRPQGFPQRGGKVDNATDQESILRYQSIIIIDQSGEEAGMKLEKTLIQPLAARL